MVEMRRLRWFERKSFKWVDKKMFLVDEWEKWA